MIKNKVVKEIISWLMYLAAAIILAVFIDKVIIMNVEVPSGSMEKTIMTGDKIIALRLSYLFDDPKRGDIVVFPFPDDEKVDYIKRIIGLPGETIEGSAEDGLVYIDGKPLDEPYVTEPITEPFGPYTIPEDSYFMMGDNRGISADARYWENKFVARDKIRGKALFRYPNFKWLK
jgi:signal peptidase I